MIAYRRLPVLVLVMPLAFSTLRADVTVRYKTEIKMNFGAAGQMVADLMKGTSSTLPQETALRLKDGKGFSTSNGHDSIIDFVTREITFLDTANKRYATMTPDQLSEEMGHAMPVMPAEARGIMASLKTDVSPARLTGRTAAIQGIEAEEREIIISIEGPATPNVPPGPTVRMVIQIWFAKPGEVMRVPAVRELTGYSVWSYAGFGPMLKQMPGSEAFEPILKAMQNGTTVLRMHMEMFMPAVAAMLQRMPPGSSPFGASFDPAAPFMQMDQELVEISTASVPDAVFRIPEGYQEEPRAELIKSLFAKTPVALPRQTGPPSTPPVE